MQKFSSRHIKQLLTAAQSLPFDAAPTSLEIFVQNTLSLSAAQAGALAGNASLPSCIELMSQLSYFAERERFSRQNMPKYCVYEDATGTPHISGLSSRLAAGDFRFSERLKHHDIIKNEIASITDGHHLEAIGAAIFKSGFGAGIATQSAADEGIDAIGKLTFGKLQDHHESARYGSRAIDEKIVFLASSKALMQNSRTTTLSPAAIRELVGASVVQRSASGAWQRQGIRLLTPVQLVLLTTYRLSDKSWRLCRELGLCVWALPELVTLICLVATDDVFDSTTHIFRQAGFKQWWSYFDSSINRLQAI